jgi:hypothetical protein
MSTWRALPGQALGAMIEVLETRSPWCAALGHQWVWSGDTIACKVPACRASNQAAFVACLESPEFNGVLADELRKRAA